MRLSLVVPDPGLRLGVVEQWLRSGTLPDVNGVFDAALRRVQADGDLWYEEEGERKLDLDPPSNVDDVLRHAVEAFSDLEVDAAALQGITTLDFDGGNEVYCDLILDELAGRLGCESWRLDTGGETSVFEVRSLQGVQRLLSLEVLNLDAHGFNPDGHDCAPLAGHPSLHTVVLFGVVHNAQALLEVPKLARVGGAPRLPDAVRIALAERGVEVA